jgi:hypothetical protein
MAVLALSLLAGGTASANSVGAVAHWQTPAEGASMDTTVLLQANLSNADPGWDVCGPQDPNHWLYVGCWEGPKHPSGRRDGDCFGLGHRLDHHRL